MVLKKQLDQAKKNIAKTAEKAKQSDVSDLHRIYRKFLRQLPKVSHLKNIVLFSGIGTMLIFVLFAQRFSALEAYLPVEPAVGGSYTEGVVGQIKQLNPLFTPTNSAEDAAASLIYSGLVEKGDDRGIYADMAERWEISEDGKTYKFYLKEDIFWHDGEKLTADDVLYTIESIQNPDTVSPLFSSWEGVEVSINGEREVTMKLENVYAPFIYNCDVPIIPRHIFESTPAESLRFSELSLSPVGSGPFVFSELAEIKDSQEVRMVANENYYKQSPYIQNVIIKTYPNYPSLTEAYTRKDIQGMERVVSSEIGKSNRLPNLGLYNLSTPQYDVLYYNMREQSPMNDLALRDAVSYAMNRTEISENIYNEYAIPIYSPILPGYLGYNRKIKQKYNLSTAKKKLKDAKYTISESGSLKKDGKTVSLRLLVESTLLKEKEASLVAEMIEKLGIDVTVESFPFSVLSTEYIAARNFDLLLVSQNLGPDSDVYSFYHSSQTDAPGLNFSGVSSRELDKYIEDARTTHSNKERVEKYSTVAKLLEEQKPAAFLVWPDYVYGVSQEVGGISSEKLVEPKNRFWNIEDWFIVSKRVN